MVVDRTFEPNPKRKGSYYRRIEDIERALTVMKATRLSDGPKFMMYFFGCEKLALGIVGIHKRWSASDAYKKKLKLADVTAACGALQLAISNDDLNYLFASHNELKFLSGYNGPNNRSARHLRNRLAHDFGPTNAIHILSHASFLVPRMEKFLKCAPSVLTYLQMNYSHIP